MSSFYVTLPSNASLDVYPNNTLTDYHVELPVPIHLDGKYEVALHSMQYTRSWDNISEGDTKIKFSINDVKVKFDLEIGHYSDPEDLIEIINNTIIKQKAELIPSMNRYLGEVRKSKFIFISYLRKGRHASILMRPRTTLTLPEKLATMLGFEQSKFIATTEELIDPRDYKSELISDTILSFDAKLQVDLEQGRYALYIYCDIIAPQIVGNTLSPLLKVVPVEGAHGENIMKEYITPQYVPVQTNLFNNIHISVRDDSGERVPFERGRVTLTLHFRRQSEI